MKAKRFRYFRVRLCFIAGLYLLNCQALTAQTFIYDFETYTLKSGTDKTVGAVYLFTTVKTGTDAVVKITAISGGLTISAIDNATQGYAQAFQPVLNVPLATTTTPKVNTYAEFSITFIVAGSYVSPTSYTIQAQPNVPATALDIDGTVTTSPADSLFEYDMLDLGTSDYIDYSTTGGQLVFTHTGTQYTGQTFTATNYSGINTTALAVMFTVLNASLTTPLIFRTGIITELPAATASRVTSLAFFKPVYPASVLPVTALTDFNGVLKNNAVNLQWQLAPGQQWSALSLQRSAGDDQFRDIQDYNIRSADGNVSQQYSYTDLTIPQTGKISYRLKMTTEDGVSQFSNTLAFLPNGSGQPSFRISPNIMSHTATMNIAVSNATTGVLKLEDYSGRELYRQALSLDKGSNSLPFSLPGYISPGNYLAVLLTNGKLYTQKLVITQ